MTISKELKYNVNANTTKNKMRQIIVQSAVFYRTICVISCDKIRQIAR